MSSVNLADKDGQTYRPDVFPRTEGADTVVVQAVTNVDPATGLPNASTEATLLALKAVADNLLLASQAIVIATEALNTKAVALNTGAIAGAVSVSNFPASVDVVSVDNFPATQTIAGQVSLDAPTLAALETINAHTGGLTNTELRASPILANNSQYDTIIDEPNANTIYICEALIGTASSASLWRVQRITTAGTVKTIRFAGTGAFDQIANNRAALTYA